MITGAAHHPRRLLAALVPLLLAATLSGCAGRPEGVLVPTASAAVPGEQVDILVATTRQPSKDPGILFSGERGRGLEATDIAVSIPPAANREVGEVQWPKRLPADPAKEFATVRVAPVKGEAEAGRWLSQHLPPSKRVFVFVHGFNNRYEEAVYRFAQIVHDSGTEAAPVLFTWPSRASIFDYNYDKESANYSRDGLEDVLDQIADNPQVEDIVIMAHSMGSWLTVEALRQMAIRDGRVAPKIRNVILASASTSTSSASSLTPSASRAPISRCSSRVTTGRCSCRGASPAASTGWARSIRRWSPIGPSSKRPGSRYSTSPR